MSRSRTPSPHWPVHERPTPDDFLWLFSFPIQRGKLYGQSDQGEPALQGWQVQEAKAVSTSQGAMPCHY